MQSAKYLNPKILTTTAQNNSATEQIMEISLNMGGNNLNGLPTTEGELDGSDSAVSLQIVDDKLASVTSIAANLKEAVLTSLQLDNAEGVLPGFGLYFTALPASSGTIILKSGTHAAETFTEGTHWARGASAVDSMTNLAAYITANSTNFDAKFCAGLKILNSAGVVIFTTKIVPAASDNFRVYGSATNAQVISYSAATATQTGSTDARDYSQGKEKGTFALNATDPGAVNYAGFFKAFADLLESETHTCRNENNWLSWDADDIEWFQVNGGAGVATNGLPSGGSDGQLLYKSGGVDYAAAWAAGVKIADSGNTLSFSSGIRLLSNNGTNYVSHAAPTGLATNVTVTWGPYSIDWPASAPANGKYITFTSATQMAFTDIPSTAAAFYQGRILFVDPSHSQSTGNTALGLPFPTIQAAINAANDGDTVMIAPGAYTEDLAWSKSISLVGWCADFPMNSSMPASTNTPKVVITGTAAWTPNNAGSYRTLAMTNICFTRSTGAAAFTITHANNTTDAKIYMNGCAFRNAGSSAGDYAFSVVGVGAGTESLTILAENCQFVGGIRSFYNDGNSGVSYKFIRCGFTKTEWTDSGTKYFNQCEFTDLANFSNSSTNIFNGGSFINGSNVCCDIVSGSPSLRFYGTQFETSATNFITNTGGTSPSVHFAYCPITGTSRRVVSTLTPRYKEPRKTAWLSPKGADLPDSNFPAGPTKATVSSRVFYYLEFADAVTQTAQLTFAIPPDYDGGDLLCRIHWTTATASGNNVVWQLKAHTIADNDAISFSGTAATVTDANANGAATANVYNRSAEVTVIVNGATAGAGELMTIEVARLGGDGSDNLAAPVRLIGVSVEYN